jgi:hypothetical protein
MAAVATVGVGAAVAALALMEATTGAATTAAATVPMAATVVAIATAAGTVVMATATAIMDPVSDWRSAPLTPRIATWFGSDTGAVAVGKFA